MSASPIPAGGAAFSASELQGELTRLSGRQVLLCLTDNKSRMVSVRRIGNGATEARLHRMFLGAPADVVGEIAGMIADRESGRAALRAFINTHIPARDDGPPRRVPEERTRAVHHDIAQYADHLNKTYLKGRSTAAVVWGRKHKTKSRRAIRFGCYDPSRNMIIMNRKLDNPDIPRYFVEFILFHEMLHEVLGIDQGEDGRRVIHGRTFKLMESTYPDYDKAMRFERELCTRLGTL